MAGETLAGERLDRLPTCSFHYRVLALIGAGLFLDSFDIYMQGPVLAQMVRTHWSDASGNASFLSITFAGLLTGALLSGWLGDRLGRRTMYQLNLLLFGLVTLTAAFSPSFHFLVGCRYLIGIGLGGEVITGYGTLAEFVPATKRGRWQGMLAFLSNAGLPGSALLSLAVIPRWGWRWMFGIVGAMALLAWAARKAMPESPRWYESKGRHAEAEALLAKIEAEVERATARRLAPVSPALGPDLTTPAASVAGLFQRPLLRRTILAMTLMICVNIAVYTFTAWVPTILVGQGVAIASTLLFTSLMQFGSLPGALAGAWAIDHLGRRPALISCSVAAAAVSVVYAFMHGPVGISLTGFLLTLLLYALVAMTFGVYVPEIFPTEVRLTGSGISNASGRVANIFAPYGVVFLLTRSGSPAVYFFMATFLVLQAFAVLLLGEETRQKSLEEIGRMASETARQ